MSTININLLPEEMRGTAKGGGGVSLGGGGIDSAAMAPIGIGLVVAVALGAIPWAANSFYLEPRRAAAQQAEDEVTAEINKYQVTLNQLKGIADNKEYLRSQLATLQSVAGVTSSWGDVLNELRSQTPANLWFNNLKSDQAKSVITLEGGALDYGSVAYFHRNLDHSEYFYEPQLSKTELSQSSGVNVVKFTLSVKVRLIKNKT
jgi:Tfp pilus assembly protein PilN